MSKRILFLGYNFHPEKTGIGKYSSEMMRWLANQGHHCTVITAYPYYPWWRVQKPYRKKRFFYTKEITKSENGGKLIVQRCPMYVPSNPTGFKRILLDLSFLFSMSLPLLGQFFKRKQDCIIAVAPTFLIGLPAITFQKIRKVKYIYHIQDLQIEAAEELKLIKSKFLIDILYRFERRILRNADTVSSISIEMLKKIEAKVNRELYFFPNWADIESYYPIEEKSKIKQLFGIGAEEKVVLYSGAIGEKQGLEQIITAAKYFENSAHIRFIICGSGPYKNYLRELAQGLGLSNVTFFPLQPAERFNEFLNIADIHLVIQKAQASDLVMPSKLTTILAVGGFCIITAPVNSSLSELARSYQLAVVIEPENQEALNTAIEHSFANEETMRLIQTNARAYAEDYLDLEKIMNRFKQVQLDTIET